MTEIEFIKEFLSSYGPLGLGWVFFGALLVKMFKLMEQGRQKDLLQAEVLTSLAAAVESLENTMGTHQSTLVELQAMMIKQEVIIEQIRK